jgi:hypothetical protein
MDSQEGTSARRALIIPDDDSPFRMVPPPNLTSKAAEVSPRPGSPARVVRLPTSATAESPRWLALKDTSALTPSDFVIYNNISLLAQKIDALTVAVKSGYTARPRSASPIKWATQQR